MVNIMLIDFQTLSQTSNQGLLSGRDNGEMARDLFKVSKSNLTPSTILKVKDDRQLVISNSYFLGLLGDFFKIHSSKESLLQHIDYTELSPVNQKELLRGINRGFASVVNAMG